MIYSCWFYKGNCLEVPRLKEVPKKFHLNHRKTHLLNHLFNRSRTLACNFIKKRFGTGEFCEFCFIKCLFYRTPSNVRFWFQSKWFKVFTFVKFAINQNNEFQMQGPIQCLYYSVTGKFDKCQNFQDLCNMKQLLCN